LTASPVMPSSSSDYPLFSIIMALVVTWIEVSDCKLGNV
jgi:hypothetical protein